MLSPRKGFCYNEFMHKTDTKRALLGVGIPVAIQNLITYSLNFVDTAMISYVSEEALAAVTLANQVFFLMILITFGIASGSGSFLSQFMGREDEENIKRTVSATLLFAGSVGFVSMIAAMLFGEQLMGLLIREQQVIQLGSSYLVWVAPSYLFTTLSSTFMVATRSTGRARIAMIASSLAVLSNIIFDYLLIFGKFGFPQMGIVGAALATTIARIFEFALMVWFVYRYEKLIAPRLRHFKTLTSDFLRALLRTSLPVVANETLWALGIVLYTVHLGFLGQGAVAAFQVTRNLYNFFDVGFFGLASAASFLLGVSIGSGRIEEAKQTARDFMKYSIFGSMGFMVLLFVLSPYLLQVFELSVETYEMARSMMRILGSFLILKNINLLFIVGIARGGGDTRHAMFIEVFGVWGIGVPIAFISVFLLKLDAVFIVLLLQAEEVAKSILCIRRLRNHRWIHDLTSRFEERNIA